MQGGVHPGVRPPWHCRLLHRHTGQGPVECGVVK